MQQKGKNENKKEKRSWRTHISQFQSLLQNESNQGIVVLTQGQR